MLVEAENGVVFVSWGSMIRASTLPDDKREELLQAFGSLKQLVIWKYENDTIQNKPSNVHIGKWFPQKDILCTLFSRIICALINSKLILYRSSECFGLCYSWWFRWQLGSGPLWSSSGGNSSIR